MKHFRPPTMRLIQSLHRYINENKRKTVYQNRTLKMACSTSAITSPESLSEADLDESFDEVLVEVESGITEILLVPKARSNCQICKALAGQQL